MKRLALVGAVAVAFLASGAQAVDSFSVHLVSQTGSTITLGWSPQPGYGYLFTADGVLRSRTNDPNRSTVMFSKQYSSFDIDVITKGANGHYPAATPPPPKAQCEDGADNDGDGKIDYPSDPGCSSPADNDETNVVTPPPVGYPNADNTGVPPGTTLTAYTGPSNITTPNTVINGKTIGCISVSTTGVVIRNSKISCGGGYALFVDDRSTTVTAVTIEDSEVDCKNAGGSAGIGESDITARRVEITHCENGADMNQNILIEDSYIHDLYNGGASHADGVQVALGHWNGSSFVCCGLNITLRHNTIFGMGDGDTTFGTSAIITTSADENLVVDNNLLAGGAYTLYCNRPGTAKNSRFVNNKFSRRFKASVGFYGPWTDCQDEVQSGNVYYETGLPLAPG